MGRASRNRRQAHERPHRQRRDVRASRVVDPRAAAEGALQRLLTSNRPGRVSLAGAYALGYGGLGMAQIEDEGPDWFDQLDPLDTLFLGTAWPQQFHDAYEFGNARTAWLRLMRETPHWDGIERFVRETIAASEQHRLPVDEGELMLLLAGRLEDAGLDRRALPAALLPSTALASARFLTGPAQDYQLPGPSADAEEQARRFWLSTEADLSHDGTASDALREGVHLLAEAGLQVREDPLTLLVALYIALVADDDEELSEAGERAQAWALGLAEDSPLAAVVDVLLTAVDRELSADTALGHLFAVDSFTAAVSGEDRQWHSEPGTDLPALAFQLGFARLPTRGGDVVHLVPAAADAIRAQYRRFEEKFGRPPGPDDPIFFNPDSDEPTPLSLLDAERESTALLEAAGIHPAWVYANQHTGGLLPRPDGTFVEDANTRDWNQAVDRYLRAHPGEAIDHDAEATKYRTMMGALGLSTATGDPEHAAALIARLSEPDESDDEVDLVRDLLTALAPDLTARLHADQALSQRAAELARAWLGQDLAERVQRVADTDNASSALEDLPVLLAAFAADNPRL
jgi:hypothetical protein